jgi:5'-nucleotidase
VVTTSGQYGYLGRLVVDFDRGGNVIGWDGGPIRIVDESFADGVAPDPGLVATVEEPVADFVAALDEQILGVSEVDLDGRRSPGVRTDETNEGNLIADSQLWQARQVDPGVDVALQNGGGIRNDSVIPAGDISALDTFDMVPFPNFVTIVPDIPRDQFKEILENAVSRTQPGDTPGGTGRFAQVAGFSFVYDGAGTAQVLDADGNVTVAGSRVRDVQLDDGTLIVTGGAVVPGAAIDIAIVDFLARGGDEYPFRGAPFEIIGVSYQQALADYIEGPLGGVISAADYPVGGQGRIIEL